MTNLSCSCRGSCVLLSVFASVIVGVIAAIFRFTAIITVTPAFLWVLFGIGVVYTAIAAAIAPFLGKGGCNNCCGPLSALLAGTLGTVLTSVILLGITFAATSVVGAIITGLLLFFFSLAVTSAACLAKCAAGCGE